jgi:hypothetical protein
LELPWTGDGNPEFQVVAVYRRAEVIYNHLLASRYLSAVNCLTPVRQSTRARETGWGESAHLGEMMTRNARHRFVFVFPVALVLIGIRATDARAEFDIGGFGMGFMPMRMVPSPGDYINSLSLIQAGRATMGPVSRPVYANNPNSYLSRVRDNGFTPHYSVSSRRSPGMDGGRGRALNSSKANNDPPPQPQAAPVPRPVIAIASFFNAARTLVWPNDSPVTGDLKEKRDTSDQACLMVADLVEKFRSAPITTVTEARQKLLTYGQPALSEIRSHSTPRIAESFHLFLLSLYDSLEQAAEPPGPVAASNAPPPPP